MIWQTILAAILGAVATAIATALVGLVPMILARLKKEKWVEKAHLEDFFATLLPQVAVWVEYWAENLFKRSMGRPPTSDAKIQKGIELVKENLPPKARLSDEAIRLRIEHALLKDENGAKPKQKPSAE